MKNIFLTHPHNTDNPQGYWEHGLFALGDSLILIWYSLLGIIHAVFPFVFKFSTSSAVIRSFKKLVISNRHFNELEKYNLGSIDLKEINPLMRKKRKGGTNTPNWVNVQ